MHPGNYESATRSLRGSLTHIRAPGCAWLSTNTQGTPLALAPISPSPQPSLHVPVPTLAHRRTCMNNTRPLEFAAFIGIDWADKKHDVCLQLAGSEKTEHQILKHTPEAID